MQGPDFVRSLFSVQVYLFTPYIYNNYKRLEDSVFSPDKRSMDAERASLRTDAQPKRKRAEYAGLKAPY